MKIVKDWTTLEIIEFLNSYKKGSIEDQGKYFELMDAVRNELKIRQPLIGELYSVEKSKNNNFCKQ